jgi:nucleoside-diphosphate-sugar epimerase
VKVLVTGATGFIGDALVRRLAAAGHDVTGAVRHEVAHRSWMATVATGDLAETADFGPLVAGMDAVVHLAARVHMMREAAADPDAVYRRANAEVTERLAAAATAAGVSRFVFLSSVKVNGESTADAPFDENSPPAPEDAYGRSKLAAEQALAAHDGGPMTVVSLRTPLIYGPGVKANFAALMRVCDSPLPLPLDGITGNRRSLLFLGNLTHAIERVLTAETAVAGTYLLCDGEDLSTTGLVRRLRSSFCRRTLPLPIPPRILRGLAGLAGRTAAADRLCGSLRIDAGRFCDTYDWTPPFTVGQGLAATASRHRASS